MLEYDTHKCWFICTNIYSQTGHGLLSVCKKIKIIVDSTSIITVCHLCPVRKPCGTKCTNCKLNLKIIIRIRRTGLFWPFLVFWERHRNSLNDVRTEIIFLPVEHSSIHTSPMYTWTISLYHSVHRFIFNNIWSTTQNDWGDQEMRVYTTKYQILAWPHQGSGHTGFHIPTLLP